MASTHEHEKSPARNERLEARITSEQKDLLQRAAALTGRTLTEFVVASAYDNAMRTVHDHEIMTLTRKDAEIFVSAILNPPKPGARLRKAAKFYKERTAR